MTFTLTDVLVGAVVVIFLQILVRAVVEIDFYRRNR